MIVYIGWGSLIWDPGELPVEGQWNADGPALPLEFARQSSNGRVTLVIVPQAASVNTLWAPAATMSTVTAMRALARREKSALANIGCVTRDAADDPLDFPAGRIRDWLEQKGFQAAIWTALPPQWNGRIRVPDSDEVLDYLRGLGDPTRALAEEYVRRAPAQVATRYRRLIENHLGWTPVA